MRHPSTEEIEEMADDLGISFSDGEPEDYAMVVGDTLDLLEGVEELPEPQLPPRDYEYTDRSPGYEPDDEEDPHNAWITKCTIEGADNGPLAGLSVGLKDNVSVAGIELTNGSDVMQGYVPAVDATIVTRLLDAGATIDGKNNMWSFSLGASDYGPAKNPNAPEYSIGGSSSGTAAAVAAGEVDIGIGGDQGGSIRIPCSFGGLVGLKPTHGLVPYTGIFGADASLDHTGPMTRTVEEAALAMDAIAGRDGLDPRQPHELEVQDYTGALDEDVSDMTVGVLREGFEHDVSDPEVNNLVHDGIAELEAMGAEVTEVSIPEHTSTESVALNFLLVFGGASRVLEQNGMGVGFDGWYDTGAVEYLGRALDSQSNDIPDSMKNAMLATKYLLEHYQGALYGKAQNITLALRETYDEALADVDALVMPTSPVKPPAFGSKFDLEMMTEQGVELDIAKNTSLFDVTHHPALTVPCGETDGAPVGMMFVGDRFDDATLFQLGYAYEQYTSE
jgi:amidase